MRGRGGSAAHRMPCGKCGYTLRAIGSAVCPECGSDCCEPVRPDNPSRFPRLRGVWIAVVLAGVLVLLVVFVLRRS